MQHPKLRGRWEHLAVLATGSLFFLGGCDPTIQQTVENGIITVSNSLLASVLQAALQVITEGNATP